jgi:hypothetical protein
MKNVLQPWFNTTKLEKSNFLQFFFTPSYLTHRHALIFEVLRVVQTSHQSPPKKEICEANQNFIFAGLEGEFDAGIFDGATAAGCLHYGGVVEVLVHIDWLLVEENVDLIAEPKIQFSQLFPAGGDGFS